MLTSRVERYRCSRRCVPASVHTSSVCVGVSSSLSVFCARGFNQKRTAVLLPVRYVDRTRSTIVARASLSRIASDDITSTLIYEIYTDRAEFKGDQRNVLFRARQTKVTDESDFRRLRFFFFALRFVYTTRLVVTCSNLS